MALCSFPGGILGQARPDRMPDGSLCGDRPETSIIASASSLHFNLQAVYIRRVNCRARKLTLHPSPSRLHPGVASETMENAQETILRLQEAVKQQARAIDTIRQEQKDTVAENDALHQKTLDWSRRFPVLEDQNRKLLKKNKTKDDEIQRLRAQTAHLAQLLASQGAGVESVKEEVKDARQDIATTAQGDGTPSDRSSTKALRDVETQMEKLTVDEAEELPHTHLHAMAGAGRHADMRKALEPLLGVDITDEVCSRTCDVVMEIIGPELAKANAQLSDCVASQSVSQTDPEGPGNRSSIPIPSARRSRS
ncbi:hypothetical protein PSPO01_14588 [Paraphaeosphaeria sporulosa]